MRCSQGPSACSLHFPRALCWCSAGGRLGPIIAASLCWESWWPWEQFSKNVRNTEKRPGRTIKETKESQWRTRCLFNLPRPEFGNHAFSWGSHRSYLIPQIRTCETHRPTWPVDCWQWLVLVEEMGMPQHWQGRDEKREPAWFWMFSSVRKEVSLCLRGLVSAPGFH